MTSPSAFRDAPRLTVGFTFSLTSDGLYFRATHTARANWHGPFETTGLSALAEMIGGYVRDDLLEYLNSPGSLPALITARVELPNRDHTLKYEPDPDFLAAHEEEADRNHPTNARR